MSNITETENLDIQFKSYKLSCLAYFWPIILLGTFTVLAYLLATIKPESLRLTERDIDDFTFAHPYLSGIGWFLFYFFVFRLICVLVWKKVIRLYTNDEGVWISYGIFPWNKGGNGVRWEDIDAAYFGGGLISWLFNSYTVIVTHKFTKAEEIYIPKIRHGKRAAAHINDMYKKQDMKRRGVEAT